MVNSIKANSKGKSTKKPNEIVSNINIDKNLIDSCTSLIKKYLEKDDDNEEKEVEHLENENEKENSFDINCQLEVTRSDSNLSFVEVIQTCLNI